MQKLTSLAKGQGLRAKGAFAFRLLPFVCFFTFCFATAQESVTIRRNQVGCRCAHGHAYDDAHTASISIRSSNSVEYQKTS